MTHDDEAIVNQPVYFGGPFVPDDTLFRRPEDRLELALMSQRSSANFFYRGTHYNHALYSRWFNTQNHR